MNSRTAYRDQRGSLLVELLIVAPLFLIFTFCVAQSALAYVGKLGIAHAASAAVRAAVVVLDDDPQFYGGAERGDVSSGNQRFAAIEKAAAVALVATCSPAQVPGLYTLYNAVAAPQPNTPLPGLLAPARDLQDRVRITFPGASGRFGPGDTVKVAVEYRFRCVVPIARRIMCRWRGGAGHLLLTDEAALPNQGASYAY